MKEKLQKILSALNIPRDLDFLNVRGVIEKELSLGLKNENPLMNELNENAGCQLEVGYKGQIYYSGTCEVREESLQELLDAAYKKAKILDPYKLCSFDSQVRTPVSHKEAASYDPHFMFSHTEEIYDLLKASNEVLKGDPKIGSATSYIQYIDRDYCYVGTSGMDITHRNQYVILNLEVMASHRGEVTFRTSDGNEAHSYQGNLQMFPRQKVLDMACGMREEAIELLTAPQCPTAKTNLVLMPNQLMMQIHESVGHPLEIDRILGDERNYAGKSFVELKDFGHLQYGSPLMNVTFDPTRNEEFASYPHDDTGRSAQKEYLVEKGVLKKGLGGIESSFRSDLPMVSCQRSATWNRPPIDRMANINLEAGDSTFDEIISNVEDGVLMNSNCSWSIDDYRRKFQFGCEYAKVIKDGQISHTVKNPNYRSTTLEFWHGLKMVGNRDTFEVYGSKWCGKGEPNQSIRVGHAAPVCLFEGVEVFGGNK